MELILEGHAQPIAVHPGETILTSLLRAGLPFPFSCQTGNCGTRASPTLVWRGG